MRFNSGPLIRRLRNVLVPTLGLSVATVAAWTPAAPAIAAAAAPHWIASGTGAPSSPVVTRPSTGSSVSTPVTLPGSNFGDMVVDGAHSHVFVSSPGSNAIYVLDYQGNILSTISGEAGADAMVINGSTLYVTLSTGGAIDRIDTGTLLETSLLTTGTLLRPYQLVMAAGALWASTQSPDYNHVCVARVDLTTGAETTSSSCVYGLGIRANPSDSSMLITWNLGLSPATITTLDVSSGSPVVLQSLREEPLGNLQDIAGGPTGTSFITASGAPYEFDEWRYSDLQQNGVIYAASYYPTAVATSSAGGGMMAGGLNAPSGNAVWVYGYDHPATQVFSGYPAAQVLPRGLAFSPNATSLFVVATTGSSTVTFAVVSLPSPLRPTVTGITSNRGPDAGGTTVTITGTHLFDGGSTCAVSAIHFGSTAASVPGTCTDTSITTTSPPGWPSSPDLTVTTPDGTSPTSAGDRFTYQPAEYSAASTQQYQLNGNDGTTWYAVDPSVLKLDLSPTAASTALLGANADLWTAAAGYNQDLGIFVSVGGTTPALVGWKESGGYAGTYSPNAAFLQATYPLVAGSTYEFTLAWKTNRSAPGQTIYAGAGPIGDQFSPTRLTARVVSNDDVASAASVYQYRLTNGSGSTWYQVDPNLTVTLTPAASASAVLGGNADLWTANSGYNQDLAILVIVDGNAGAAQLVAWKESGGYAGTFSPNAAFVQAVYPMVAGHSYAFTLAAKPNRNATGTIYLGAGPISAGYSPSRITAETAPSSELQTSVSTQQYTLPGSDGATWAPLDPGLNLTLNPAANSTALLGANADLWTANAGYNQDLAIFVTDNGGPLTLVGWKESGGFAGTFSPNAAFLQSVYPMTGGHTYVFSIWWKTNVPAAGTIYAGAGPISSAYSPTRLTVQVS